MNATALSLNEIPAAHTMFAAIAGRPVSTGAARILTADERYELERFLTQQLTIGSQGGWGKYEDPFARVGLRIRVGDRQVTRQRREASRVKAFG